MLSDGDSQQVLSLLRLPDIFCRHKHEEKLKFFHVDEDVKVVQDRQMRPYIITVTLKKVSDMQRRKDLDPFLFERMIDRTIAAMQSSKVPRFVMMYNSGSWQRTLNYHIKTTVTPTDFVRLLGEDYNHKVSRAQFATYNKFAEYGLDKDHRSRQFVTFERFHNHMTGIDEMMEIDTYRNFTNRIFLVRRVPEAGQAPAPTGPSSIASSISLCLGVLERALGDLHGFALFAYMDYTRGIPEVTVGAQVDVMDYLSVLSRHRVFVPVWLKSFLMDKWVYQEPDRAYAQRPLPTKKAIAPPKPRSRKRRDSKPKQYAMRPMQ
eukprot:TRINITY_DN2676_c0_g1_i1.p1 TRINITY_DN2676_c0_g1~~TRINITY_DN2676_c0_g1_i1.p1  ORF type:complete len:319 (-),score=61.53 TRINITY_DN2676_c0_g1_i1:50-1006(-)